MAVLSPYYLSSASTQTIEVIDEVGGRFKGFITVSTIDIEGNSVSYNEKLNIKTILYDHISSVSGNGKVIVNANRLIYKNGEAKINVIPNSFELGINERILNSEGTRLVYSEADDNGCLLYVFDIVNQAVRDIRIPESLPYAGQNISLNNDATVVALNTFLSLYVLDLTNSKAITTKINEFSTAVIPFVSFSGNRLFYNAERKVFYNDKVNGQWLSSMEIELGKAVIGGVETSSYIYDIANDGKSIVAPIGSGGIAVIHEENGVWSEPDYIGYIPDFLDKVQISENGKVVAVQSYKYTSPNNDNYYDAYIFIKNSANQWAKHQINTEDQDVQPDIHLTEDGTQLIWIPADFGSSVPSAGLHR